MYEINSNREALFKFNNRYSIMVDIGPGTETHWEETEDKNSSIRTKNRTGQIKVFCDTEDVTQKLIDDGILKRSGYITPDIFMKIANTVRKFPPVNNGNKNEPIVPEIQKIYELHWKGSNYVEEFPGKSIEDAFMRAGYGGSAISALDYYVEKVDTEIAINYFKLFENKVISRKTYEDTIPYYSRISNIRGGGVSTRIKYENGRKEYPYEITKGFTPYKKLKREIEGMPDLDFKLLYQKAIAGEYNYSEAETGVAYEVWLDIVKKEANERFNEEV